MMTYDPDDAVRGQAQGHVARLLGLVALPREMRSGQVHGLDAHLLGLVALPKLVMREVPCISFNAAWSAVQSNW